MSDNRSGSRVDTAIEGARYLLGLYLVGLLLFYAYTLSMQRVRYLNFFLTPGIALFYLDQYGRFRAPTDDEETAPVVPIATIGDTVGDRLRGWVDRVGQKLPHLYPLFAVVVLLVGVYVELNFERLQFDAPIVGTTPLDHLIGLFLIAIVIHATKVAYGWTISLVTISSVVYALFGPYFPGILQHSGMTLAQVANTGAIGLTGVYGFIMGIGATWVAVFIVFAGVAKSFGLLEYILDVSQEFSGLLRSGIVHVAMISSLIIGSLTGSAAANTATTGSFTIPMMKRQGVPGEHAAAIESVASSGAQIMPPVMGVAAFLMADILGIPYVTVLQSGTLPALLFYAAVAIGVHLLILKHGWTVERSEESIDWRSFLTGVHFAVPLGVLIYTLTVMRLTPLSSGMYSIAALAGVHVLATVLRNGPKRGTVGTLGDDLLAGAKEGALEMAPLIGVLGAMGVIVAIVQQTGLSQQLSAEIIGLAGGVFVLLLFLAMVTSILFGLGMPTPAAYILVVFLVAPALIQSGVRELAAHYYVFYFAMLSAITPPVAISVAIGSRIADTQFLPTAVQALRIGGPVFLLPYAFISNESLIYWSFPGTLVTFAVVLGGLGLLSIGLMGHDGGERVNRAVRVVAIALAGAALFAAADSLQVLAIVAGLALLGGNRWLTRTMAARSDVSGD